MNNLLKNTGRFLKKNSSIILTGLGTVGVVATALFANKAGIKAGRVLSVIDEAKMDGNVDDISDKEIRKEFIKECWKDYIPAAITGVTTITCIILAEITNQRKQASLINAYSLLGIAFKEYQHKVEELYGENANTAVRAAVAQDHIENIAPSEDNKMLFFDFNSLQYFESTLEDVIAAEYNLNRQMALTGNANLLDFYHELGVPVENTGRGSYDELWCVEPCKWIEFTHELTKVDDMDCCIISIMNRVSD